MKTRRFVHLALLRCASWMVPGRQREEWLAEWRAELWHVWQRYDDPSSSQIPDKDVIAFCVGAFSDAFWLRRDYAHSGPRRWFQLDTARRCGSSLAVLAIVALMSALVVPGARRAILRSPYRDANHVVLISHDGSTSSENPAISLEEYNNWKTRRQKIFTGFAFYRPVLNRVQAAGSSIPLSSAIASDNLFELLGIPVSPAALKEAASRHMPALVLSQTAWLRHFEQGSRIVGSVVRVDGRDALVAGIVSDDSWQLPGRVDSWLLEDAEALAALPQSSTGYVLGYAPGQSGHWHMLVPTKGTEVGFNCTSLRERGREPVTLFLFALLLACLALPATTPLPLGDYPATSERFGAVRCRRWVFLSVKTALILPLVYCGALSLAYLNSSANPATTVYIQLFTSFAGLLFFFRWSLHDQRKRCPVCLRVLTNPARVGHPSRNFLAWSGTELICGKGHGLLHVPEISTSWFGTQRWLSLDPSWHGLFREAYLPAPGIF